MAASRAPPQFDRADRRGELRIFGLISGVLAGAAAALLVVLIVPEEPVLLAAATAITVLAALSGLTRLASG